MRPSLDQFRANLAARRWSQRHRKGIDPGPRCHPDDRHARHAGH